MPRRNGTGPEGLGPITGRGRGFCQSIIAQPIDRPSVRLGLGRGNRRALSGYPVNKDLLVEEKTMLERRLTEIDETLKKQ